MYGWITKYNPLKFILAHPNMTVSDILIKMCTHKTVK